MCLDIKPKNNSIMYEVAKRGFFVWKIVRKKKGRKKGEGQRYVSPYRDYEYMDGRMETADIRVRVSQFGEISAHEGLHAYTTKAIAEQMIIENRWGPLRKYLVVVRMYVPSGAMIIRGDGEIVSTHLGPLTGANIARYRAQFEL